MSALAMHFLVFSWIDKLPQRILQDNNSGPCLLLSSTLSPAVFQLALNILLHLYACILRILAIQVQGAPVRTRMRAHVCSTLRLFPSSPLLLLPSSCSIFEGPPNPTRTNTLRGCLLAMQVLASSLCRAAERRAVLNDFALPCSMANKYAVK